jgi:hypothetical protein
LACGSLGLGTLRTVRPFAPLSKRRPILETRRYWLRSAKIWANRWLGFRPVRCRRKSSWRFAVGKSKSCHSQVGLTSLLYMVVSCQLVKAKDVISMKKKG